MNKRQLGSDYEEKACQYLVGKGYKIIERNFRTYKGEIDIVAKDGQYIVFVEVKYRTKNSFGYSAEAVNVHKQKVLYRVAEGYMCKYYPHSTPSCRFDVIAIDNDKIDHIVNAFGSL